jgi:hypothetical protein
MKLGENDKKWLRGEVKTAVAEAIGEFRPNGWQRVADFIREWGIAGTIITVFVALFGIAAGAIYQATARVAKEAAFEANTLRDLKQIRDDINAIRGDQARQSLINHASLPLSDFKTSLPQVGSALSIVEQENAAVPTSVIEGLRVKLQQTDPSAPDYWPTAVRFLQFATSRLAPSDVPPAGRAPDVESDTNLGPLEFYKGTVLLKGGSVTGALFRNCRVIFTNTPVRMTSVIFVNSVIEFRVSTTSPPSPYLRKAVEVFLASDLKSTSVPNL